MFWRGCVRNVNSELFLQYFYSWTPLWTSKGGETYTGDQRWCTIAHLLFSGSLLKIVEKWERLATNGKVPWIHSTTGHTIHVSFTLFDTVMHMHLLTLLEWDVVVYSHAACHGEIIFLTIIILVSLQVNPHNQYSHCLVLYSGKYSWGPNFVLFILSLLERKFNTQNAYYDGRVFLCKMDNEN